MPKTQKRTIIKTKEDALPYATIQEAMIKFIYWLLSWLVGIFLLWADSGLRKTMGASGFIYTASLLIEFVPCLSRKKGRNRDIHLTFIIFMVIGFVTSFLLMITNAYYRAMSVLILGSTLIILIYIFVLTIIFCRIQDGLVNGRVFEENEESYDIQIQKQEMFDSSSHTGSMGNV